MIRKYELEREHIKEFLLMLDFNINSVGFKYWIDAIQIYNYDLKITDLYNKIALKYNSTYSRVERAMRFSLRPAIKKIQKNFKYFLKIDNKTFLNLYLLNKGEIEHAN